MQLQSLTEAASILNDWVRGLLPTWECFAVRLAVVSHEGRQILYALTVDGRFSVHDFGMHPLPVSEAGAFELYEGFITPKEFRESMLSYVDGPLCFPGCPAVDVPQVQQVQCIRYMTSQYEHEVEAAYIYTEMVAPIQDPPGLNRAGLDQLARSYGGYSGFEDLVRTELRLRNNNRLQVFLPLGVRVNVTTGAEGLFFALSCRQPLEPQKFNVAVGAIQSSARSVLAEVVEEPGGWAALRVIEPNITGATNLWISHQALSAEIEDGQGNGLRPHVFRVSVFSPPPAVQQQRSSSGFAFVVMAFSKETDALYRDVIEPAIRACGLLPIRIDRHRQPEPISVGIRTLIREADIIVADLTLARPNCYYEVGYAQALGRPLVLCARKDHDPRQGAGPERRVHFDLDQYQIIYWEGSEFEPAKDALVDAISAEQGREGSH